MEAEPMPYEPLESKRVYQHAEAIADRIWEIVLCWQWFAKRTAGTQLVKAADSIGANIAEAGGRYHLADVRNFLYYSRGSLRENQVLAAPRGQAPHPHPRGIHPA